VSDHEEEAVLGGSAEVLSGETYLDEGLLVDETDSSLETVQATSYALQADLDELVLRCHLVVVDLVVDVLEHDTDSPHDC
jgi:hypothetical protein